NAASSEEMATSSEEMDTQAQQLHEVIQFFKINEKALREIKNEQAKNQQEWKNKQTQEQSPQQGKKGVNYNLDQDDELDKDYEQY
ncbi:MAG: hypothetical protein K9I68_04730, partial [Bacteroidales bacterium]|nr:hypothetical protein [Bacteroidales bacterium]